MVSDAVLDSLRWLYHMCYFPLGSYHIERGYLRVASPAVAIGVQSYLRRCMVT